MDIIIEKKFVDEIRVNVINKIFPKLNIVEKKLLSAPLTFKNYIF